MLTPSLEDYLEETYLICQKRGHAKASELAERLNVSLPSVTAALQKLGANGFIRYRAYEEASLTGLGQDVGSYLATRNKVLRDFLTLLRVDCDVPEEVESMEHYISPRVVMGIARLVDYLRLPTHELPYELFVQSAPLRETPPAVTQLAGIQHLRRFGGKVRRGLRPESGPAERGSRRESPR